VSLGTGLNAPKIRVEGTEANLGLTFQTKGTGKFNFQPNGGNPSAGLLGVDSSGNLLFAQAGGGASDLDGLTDVTLTSEAEGDFLQFDSGSSQWVNRTVLKNAAGGNALELGGTGVGSVGHLRIGNVINNFAGIDFNVIGGPANVHFDWNLKSNDSRIRIFGGSPSVLEWQQLNTTQIELHLGLQGAAGLTDGNWQIIKPIGTTGVGGPLEFRMNLDPLHIKIVEFDQDGVNIEATTAYHLGDPTTDGTWRFVRSGSDLKIERREAGVYVSKTTITA
jgi:hypothetical protein